MSAHLHRTLLASTVPSTRRAFVQPLDALRDEIRSRCLIKSGHSFPGKGRASAASRRLDASAGVSGKSTGRVGRRNKSKVTSACRRNQSVRRCRFR